jgi:hypothetical protein
VASPNPNAVRPCKRRSSIVHPPTPEGPGSVSRAPNVPAGFNYTCTSRYLDIGELRLHAVIGADRPPLLVHV